MRSTRDMDDLSRVVVASSRSDCAEPKDLFPEDTSFENLLVMYQSADPATNRKVRYQVSCYEDIAIQREQAWYLSKNNKVPKPERDKKVAQVLRKTMKQVEDMKTLYEKYQKQRIRTAPVPGHLAGPLPAV